MGLDRLVPIAVGGALGAIVRWVVADTLGADGFPWHTLIVNVIGCALLALVTAEAIPAHVQRFLAVGFCGGLTTFSTLTVEFVILTDDGELPTAIAYLVTSVVLGITAFVAARTLRPAPPTEAAA